MEENQEKLSLFERQDDPTSRKNVGSLYTKRISGITELFFQYDDGRVIQLTSDKALLGNFGLGFAVASEANVVLPEVGNVFDVTGTTTINTVAIGSRPSRSVIVFLFSSAITLSHNVAGSGLSLLLANAVSFGATANDSIGFIYDGTSLREIFRTTI